MCQVTIYKETLFNLYILGFRNNFIRVKEKNDDNVK